MTQDCKNVALKLPKISLKLPKIFLSKGYSGQFKAYILCSGDVGGFFASEGGSCHGGFTIVLTSKTYVVSNLALSGRMFLATAREEAHLSPGIAVKRNPERPGPNSFVRLGGAINLIF